MDQARGLLEIVLYSKAQRVCIIIIYFYFYFIFFFFFRISIQAAEILNGLSSFLVTSHSQEFL